MPSDPQVFDLIDALLKPNQALHTELSLGESLADVRRRIESQRDAILSAISADKLVEDAFPGTVADRVATLTVLFDALLLIPQSSCPSENLPGWFGFLQKLGREMKGANLFGLIETGLWNAIPHLGDQRFMRIIRTTGQAQSAIQSYVLQTKAGGQAEAVADRIVARVSGTSPPLPGGDDERIWGELRQRICECLIQWSKLGPVHTVKSNIALQLGFLDHVVAHVSLPNDYWERVLVSTELELSRLLPLAQFCEIGDALEPMLATVAFFSLLGEVLRRARTMPTAERQLIHLAVLQISMDQRRQSNFARLWAHSADISALHRNGWNADSIQRFFAALVESLRPNFERHELDLLSRCSEKLQRWASSVDMADQLLKSTKGTFSSLSASLVEGVADTDSKLRVMRQIEALARACVYNWLSAADPRMARALLREQVALHLNYSRDLGVWKRNKQLAASFAQIEASGELHHEAAAALRAMAQELESSISDQIKYPLRWIQLSTVAEREPGGEQSYLKITITRWAINVRVLGLSGAVGGMNRWFASWLSGMPRRVDQPAVAQAITGLLERGALLPGCESLKTGLAQWTRQSQLCTASNAIRLDRDVIVEDCITSGQTRYEERVTQGLAPNLPKGIKQTWTLGKLDCAWSLGKLSAIINSGSQSISADLLWWWQIAVGKHISLVPEPFIRAYLLSLNDALQGVLAREEADALYSPLFSCYQKNFALKGQADNADLEQWSPLWLTGTHWRRHFSGADPGNPLALYKSLLVEVCPVILAGWGGSFSLALDRSSDEDILWQLQAPALFGLVTLHGAEAVDEALGRWQHAGMDTVPVGAGVLWMGLMERAQQMLGQIVLGKCLLEKANEAVAAAEKICPEVMGNRTGYTAHEVPFSWIIHQIGVLLLSTGPSAAAIELARLIMYINTVQPDMHATRWRKIWLLLESVISTPSSVVTEKALVRWFPRMISLSDQADIITTAAKTIFASREMVFSEARSEELKWRDAISGLLATCITPDHACPDGQALLGRIVFGCDAFMNESSAAWSGRGKAILELLQANELGALANVLSQRLAEISALLHDRARIQEMPSLSAFHRCCILLKGLPGAGDQLRPRALAKALDQREVSISPEDAFVFSLTREPMPGAIELTTIRNTLVAGLRYDAPSRLEKKKFLGRDVYELKPQQVWALSHLPRAFSAATVLGDGFTSRAASDTAVYFSTLGPENPLEKLALWTATEAVKGFAEPAAAKRVAQVLGDAVAGWLLHFARITPVKGQQVTRVAQIKDVGRIYLVALLMHQIPSTGAKEMLELLSSQILADEWESARPRLDQWMQLLVKAGHQMPSTVVSEWSRFLSDNRRQAA